jgi:AraC-like DNA-binding protein
VTVRPPLIADAPSPAGRVLQILFALERAGLDTEEVLLEAGVDRNLTTALRQSHPSVSLSACSAITRAALARVETEAARRSNIAPPYAHQHALIWYATTSCRILNNAIGTLQAYSEMLAGAAGVGRIRTQSERVTLPISSVRQARDPVNFLADLFAAISLRNMLSWLIGERLFLSSCSVTYPEAFATYLPDGLLDCELRWDQPELALSFPENLLESPVVRTGADFVAMSPMEPLLTGAARRAGSFSFSVARLFDGAIANGRPLPGSAKIAERLSCSIATLQRRLIDEGTSLLSIKTERRREWAITLLRSNAISQVAKLVGFSDETAFRRAMRQWTGRPPSSFQ